MSATLDKMTAAELVAEMRIAQLISQCFGEKRGDWADQWREKYAAYTAELDARCETFEISLFERAGMVQFKYGQFLQKEGVGAWLNISAIDQHALEGYLLTKGGGK